MVIASVYHDESENSIDEADVRIHVKCETIPNHEVFDAAM